MSVKMQSGAFLSPVYSAKVICLLYRCTCVSFQEVKDFSFVKLEYAPQNAETIRRIVVLYYNRYVYMIRALLFDIQPYVSFIPLKEIFN